MSVILPVLNAELDQSEVKGAIASFPEQIQESFLIMDNWMPKNEYRGIRTILILGMGGSAIGGDVARVISQKSCPVPIIVNRSYNIPEWVDSHTLVLASSYSGLTEETLSAFTQCRNKNCHIIVLSTGGKIIEYADKYGLDRVTIPPGFQPRAALGFSFSFILLLLNRLDFIRDETIILVEDSIKPLNKLSTELSHLDSSTVSIAEQIHSTCPIIYGSEDSTWVVALRFNGQLAENAKMLSFHHHFPEQNHNEIEGWTINDHIMKNFSVILIKDKEDHDGIKLRMKISAELIKPVSSKHISISQSGENRIERLIKMIYCVDWISYYLALLNEVDPTPVNRIQKLKSRIALYG
jgi:glucose/mannose-6-phosphate isomerase